MQCEIKLHSFLSTDFILKAKNKKQQKVLDIISVGSTDITENITSLNCFLGNKMVQMGKKLPSSSSSPKWTSFENIRWGGKTYKKMGKIQNFYSIQNKYFEDL